MRASPLLSDSFRRLSPRERRVLAAGAAVSVAALAVTQVVVPLADRWGARERAYAATREHWERLTALAAREGRLRRALEVARLGQQRTATLLSAGPTPALAASGLQDLLRVYAEQSMVQLNRVDVAGDPTEDRPGLLAIPVRLQGQGDVYGLVDFLFRLQRGERLFVVDQLTVNAQAVQRGVADDQMLAWTLSAHGLYAAPGGTPAAAATPGAAAPATAPAGEEP